MTQEKLFTISQALLKGAYIEHDNYGIQLMKNETDLICFITKWELYYLLKKLNLEWIDGYGWMWPEY